MVQYNGINIAALGGNGVSKELQDIIVVQPASDEFIHSLAVRTYLSSSGLYLHEWNTSKATSFIKYPFLNIIQFTVARRTDVL